MGEYNVFKEEDIKLRYTFGEKIIIAITLIFSIVSFIYLFINWSNIPLLFICGGTKYKNCFRAC